MVGRRHQHLPCEYLFSVSGRAGREPVLADNTGKGAAVGTDMERDKKRRRNVRRQLREKMDYGLNAPTRGTNHDHCKVI